MDLLASCAIKLSRASRWNSAGGREGNRSNFKNKFHLEIQIWQSANLLFPAPSRSSNVADPWQIAQPANMAQIKDLQVGL